MINLTDQVLRLRESVDHMFHDMIFNEEVQTKGEQEVLRLNPEIFTEFGKLTSSNPMINTFMPKGDKMTARVKKELQQNLKKAGITYDPKTNTVTGTNVRQKLKTMGGDITQRLSKYSIKPTKRLQQLMTDPFITADAPKEQPQKTEPEAPKPKPVSKPESPAEPVNRPQQKKPKASAPTPRQNKPKDSRNYKTRDYQVINGVKYNFHGSFTRPE